MSIQSEIDRLAAAKASIAASLQAMGVEPPEGTTLDQYAAQLAAIAAAAPWLPLAGGTMTGPLHLSSAPEDDNEAATKGYVDEKSGGLALGSAPIAFPEGLGYDVCYGNGRFVAVGNGRIGYSRNGADWTEVDDLGPDLDASTLLRICYGNGVFVAGGTDWISDSQILYSSNGAEWKAGAFSGESVLLSSAICFGGGKFIAFAAEDAKIAVSGDGATWETHDLTISGSGIGALRILGCAYGNGRFVAVSEYGDVIYSTDGLNWDMASNSYSFNMPSITFYSGRFFIAGLGEIFSSIDGNEFSPVLGVPSTEDWSRIFALEQGLVAIDESRKTGSCIFSEDGLTWTERTLPGSARRTCAAYGNGKSVLLSQDGVEAVSGDGKTWSAARPVLTLGDDDVTSEVALALSFQ